MMQYFKAHASVCGIKLVRNFLCDFCVILSHYLQVCTLLRVLSTPSLCQTKWSNFNCWKSRHHANPASSMQVHLTIILCQFCCNLVQKKENLKISYQFWYFGQGGWLMITVSIGLLTKFNMTLRNWLCSANLTWNTVITPVRSQIFVKKNIILHFILSLSLTINHGPVPSARSELRWLLTAAPGVPALMRVSRVSAPGPGICIPNLRDYLTNAETIHNTPLLCWPVTNI